MATTVEELLVKQLDQAYAMEQAVSTLLDGMIRTTSDPSIVADLENHKQQTAEHAEKVRRCLEGHGASPSRMKETLGMVAALMKGPADLLRGEQDMRNARDGFATEHLEIATYRVIEELAKAADDKQALQVARENIADEERMAARIQRNWARVVDASIHAEGARTA